MILMTRTIGRIFSVGAVMASLVMVAGCGGKKNEFVPGLAPGAETVSGPAYLHGTIESYGVINGFVPRLVTGYGFVVGLDDTGSTKAPVDVRDWLLKEMSKRGVGRSDSGTEHVSPKEWIASKQTSVVRVYGEIPPGAIKGTKFDVYVEAVGDETTSLVGGTLLEVMVSPNGLKMFNRNETKLAKVAGALYINPTKLSGDDAEAQHQEGVIIGGGVSISENKLNFLLHSENFTLSRQIADRINYKFYDDRYDKQEIASAQSSRRIEIHIPQRYKRDPGALLSKIYKLYLNDNSRFVKRQAKVLGAILENDKKRADVVSTAWQSLGELSWPVVRQYYGHEDYNIQMAALNAGARMGDGLVLRYIRELIETGDHIIKRDVSPLLAKLMEHRSSRSLIQELLDDRDFRVRRDIYEAMVDAGGYQSVIVSRDVGAEGKRKFRLDLVPSKHQLIYVSHHRVPRIAIFGDRVTFSNWPILLWENRLRAFLEESEIEIKDTKLDDDTGKRVVVKRKVKRLGMKVFYQSNTDSRLDGKKPVKMAPYAANWVRLLGSNEPVSATQDGYDLNFDRVVNALHIMKEKGHIDAEFQIRSSGMVNLVEFMKKRNNGRERAEIVSESAEGDVAPKR